MNPVPKTFSQILVPHDLDTILIPVFEHFAACKYHQEACAAEWNADKIRKDFANETIASGGYKKVTRTGSMKYSDSRVLLQLERDVFVYHMKADHSNQLTIFAPTAELALAKMDHFAAHYLDQPEPKPYFSIASAGEFGGLELRRVELDPAHGLSDSRLDLHYGDGFTRWHADLTGKLSERKFGLTILHGDPGTGKTTYLRHLIVKLSQTHRFLYLPLDQSRMLSEVATVDFWRSQQLLDAERKLVVIMEDAEAFLLARDASRGNTRVADLLNIGDGLMGDFLKMHIVCTINCSLDDLDRAVTRAGRLLGYRRFERLSRQQAQRIAASEKLVLTDQPDYSLAEIYNGRAVFDQNRGKEHLGFAA
jgi:hypothetical protein